MQAPDPVTTKIVPHYKYQDEILERSRQQMLTERRMEQADNRHDRRRASALDQAPPRRQFSATKKRKKGRK